MTQSSKLGIFNTGNGFVRVDQVIQAGHNKYEADHDPQQPYRKTTDFNFVVLHGLF